MQAPKKLNKADLKHPADKRSSFNGDKIRPASDNGFMKAKRVYSVEGTTPPRNTKGVDIASIDSAPGASTRDITGVKPFHTDIGLHLPSNGMTLRSH